MKTLTTIQITLAEDREIMRLKKEMELPSKKAVVLEGLHALRKILQDQMRRKRLQSVSRLVRKESSRHNASWASLSAALKTK